jgi:hypothetical protein
MIKSINENSTNSYRPKNKEDFEKEVNYNRIDPRIKAAHKWGHYFPGIGSYFAAKSAHTKLEREAALNNERVPEMDPKAKGSIKGGWSGFKKGLALGGALTGAGLAAALHGQDFPEKSAILGIGAGAGAGIGARIGTTIGSHTGAKKEVRRAKEERGYKPIVEASIRAKYNFDKIDPRAVAALHGSNMFGLLGGPINIDRYKNKLEYEYNTRKNDLPKMDREISSRAKGGLVDVFTGIHPVGSWIGASIGNENQKDRDYLDLIEKNRNKNKK